MLSERKSPRKRKHHYVPRFYLSGFEDPQNPHVIWIYEKGKDLIRAGSKEVIAVQNDYHTYVNGGGTVDTDSVEDLLSKVEGAAAKVLKNIESLHELGPPDRLLFSCFLAFMAMRGPRVRDDADRMAGEQEKALRRFIGRRSTASAECSEDSTLDLPSDLIAEPTFSLGLMFHMAKPLSAILNCMNWTTLVADGNEAFLTSDSPMVRVLPYGGGLAVEGPFLSEDVEITLPLSKSHALYCSWTSVGSNHIRVRTAVTREINRRTVISAARFVYAPIRSRHLNQRLVQKYAHANPVRIVETKSGPNTLEVRGRDWTARSLRELLA